MRIPRKFILSPNTYFHKMWRAHNKERILQTNDEKKHYLTDLFRYKNKANKEGVKLFSFCIMSNHVHEVGEIGDSIEGFSGWMRCSHSVFGQGYNKRHNRSGKVAEDRPKSVQIENEVSLFRTMFYLDSNPVRAGIVKHPKDYKWSCYRFYAYGEENEWTKNIDIPECYKNLGDTPQQRQEIYREMCDAYIKEWMRMKEETEKEAEKPKEKEITPSTGLFFGSPAWVEKRNTELRSKLRELKKEYEARRKEREKEFQTFYEKKKIACSQYDPGG